MELQMVSSQKAQNLRRLYFDGQKDNSCTQISISDTKFSRTLVKEKHISLVQKPGFSYLAIQHWHKQ